MSVKTAKTETKKAEERVLIHIPHPADTTGDTETVVSVNGVMYQIQYDTPVHVPKSVAEVIMQSRRMNAKIAEVSEAAKMMPGKAALAEL